MTNNQSSEKKSVPAATTATNVTKKRIILRPAVQMVDELSDGLYRDLTAALGEAIFNSIDAATLRGVTPKIQIKSWRRGEHPLVAGSRGLSILDNGIGFTDSVIEAYCNPGVSANKGRKGLHGAHGLGKFAIFALCAEGHKVFHILTSIGGKEVWEYCLDREHIWDASGFEANLVTGKYPGLPAEGPFTMMFVGDANPELDLKGLGDELTYLLPLRPLEVTVDNVPVKKREFATKASIVTPAIPNLGVVDIQLAVTKVASGAAHANESVFLVDADTGRLVCDLQSLPPNTKGRLSGWMFHPRLTGLIRVEGLEKDSSASRSGLDARFWTTSKGRRLVDTINCWGEQLARQLVEETGGEPSEVLKKALLEVQDLFWTANGKPEHFAPGALNETRQKSPVGKPEDAHNYPPHRRPTTPTGKGEKTPRWEMAVRIEGTDYPVIYFTSGGKQTPAYVNKDYIIIDVDHPEFARLLKSGAPRLLREGIVHFLLEAHVAATRNAAAARIFSDVYLLKQVVLSGGKK